MQQATLQAAVWSLLKRSIKDTYVSVDPFHLFRYLDEQSFRHNERTGRDGDRFTTVVGSAFAKRLTCRTLTGKDMASAHDVTPSASRSYGEDQSERQCDAA